MKRNLIIGAAVVGVLVLLYIIIGSKGGSTKQAIKVPVKRDLFEVTVTTTGELLAKNSEKIMGPRGLRQARLWNVKITDIIPEGTIVEEGDFIATLDKSEIGNKLSDLATELEKIESQYIQIKLDTTLSLREARDNLVNLRYQMEEKKIALEQSKFEPPATIRKAEIDYDKSQRAIDQESENYKVKVNQSKAKMQEVAATLTNQRRKYDQMLELVSQFTIRAPKAGMVIYLREWDGKKKAVGGTISAWDPAVATLPDLSMMISKTYVNEVDIRKVKVGQEVKVGVDAFPEKSYIGKVTEVANVGEQRPHSDAKVFEVVVELIGSDTILRPSMTTSNTILADSLHASLLVPLEALHSNDSITYVFKSGGFSTVKKEVRVGLTNENEAVIEQGLEEGEEVLLSVPDNGETLKLIPLGK